MKKALFILAIAGASFNAITCLAQVGINNPDPDESSILDLKSTEKGVLIPRMTSLDRESIEDPAEGLMLFDTDLKMFFFYDGTEWLTLNPWKSTGQTADPVHLANDMTVGKVSVDTLNVDGFSSNALVPSGVILMWSGDEDSVPEGWALCDGGFYTHEGKLMRTPNLKGRFVVGYDPSNVSYNDPGSLSSGSFFDFGKTGGAENVTLTISNMPSHNHTASVTTAGAHSHLLITDHSASDSWGGGTPSHHAIAYRSSKGHLEEYKLGYHKDHTTPNKARSSTSGGHRHTVTIRSRGGGTAHENRPPYYVLAYIMKL